ncbi:YoaK family protein [Caulobacter segnis]|uniref:YoaK family protein n=1 Tax=Caulobacter segnis TaxID=88688 RepID=UPI0028587591|nr:YoaK family protein [Caulobacter segnis]MDR6624426.1 uncharacterized membrane protein YoaK (UPF0700 family) [Caulobacter segnis]
MGISAQPPWLAGATGVGMALVGGYVDVVGFVLLFGLFVNHATGNLVMLGVSLAGGGQGLATKLLSLPVFIAAAAATYVMICRRRARGQANEAAVLLAQAVMLAVFMLLTVAALPAENADAPKVMLAGLVGVCAMAVQNVGARVVFSHLAPTTIMTGNVTQIAIDLVDLLSSKTGLDEALRARIVKTWPPVMAFAVGAIGGAVGVILAGPWSLLPAAVVVAILGGLYAHKPRAVQA